MSILPISTACFQQVLVISILQSLHFAYDSDVQSDHISVHTRSKICCPKKEVTSIWMIQSSGGAISGAKVSSCPGVSARPPPGDNRVAANPLRFTCGK